MREGDACAVLSTLLRHCDDHRSMFWPTQRWEERAINGARRRMPLLGGLLRWTILEGVIEAESLVFCQLCGEVDEECAEGVARVREGHVGSGNDARRRRDWIVNRRCCHSRPRLGTGEAHGPTRAEGTGGIEYTTDEPRGTTHQGSREPKGRNADEMGESGPRTRDRRGSVRQSGTHTSFVVVCT